MINHQSLDAVKAAQFSHFCRPLYHSFCFSRIPHTVEYLLTLEGKAQALPDSCFPKVQNPYDAIIVLLLDGFGWRFFEKFMDHPLLKRFVKQGYVSKITSQFPSTTAGHVTCIHTGLETGQSGIYEWFHYDPLVDQIIAPLLFSYAGSKVADALIATELDPKQFFPFSTIYDRLHAKGISSYVFQSESICHSPYSRTVGKGAHPIAFFSLPQALASLQESLNFHTSDPIYAFLYFADIDSVGHRHGPSSAEIESTILQTLDNLQTKWLDAFGKGSKRIGLIITADHGMCDVNPKKTHYLNKEIPILKEWIRKNKKGQLLVPAGSCRDFFLHLQPNKIDDAKNLLKDSLKGLAEVCKVQDLIQEGFFGEKSVSKRFLDRVGDLVILPYQNESVWWYEKGKFEQHFYGAHGGLTPLEMETLFLFLDL